MVSEQQRWTDTSVCGPVLAGGNSEAVQASFPTRGECFLMHMAATKMLPERFTRRFF